MTASLRAARSSRRTAEALRELFRELFRLSTAQVEALDRQDFASLEETLAKKTHLLELLAPALSEAERYGWKLHDSSTFPTSDPCADALREAAELSRRLQAHERFVLGQLLTHRDHIGHRLDAVMNKRFAAAGYRVPKARGATVDTAR